MQVFVLKQVWTGFVGGPGLSQFVMNVTDGGDLQSGLQAIEDFFLACASLIPNNITLTPQTEALSYEHTTGVLTGGVTLTSVGATTGTATGNWSAASGASVRWETGEIQEGRRVRGRTFLVPLAVNAYGDDGLLTPSAVTTLESAATAISGFTPSVGTGSFCVWGRPREATETTPAKAATLAEINGASVPQKVAVLTGRRD